MFEEVINEIEEVIKDKNLAFSDLLEKVRDILWENQISSDNFDYVLESFNSYVYNYMQEKRVEPQKYSSMVNDIYSFFRGYFELNDEYFSSLYYETLIEKISSKEIILTSDDIAKANEYIDRAIDYCAYYMGKIFMSEDFFPGEYTVQEKYDYYSKPYGDISRSNVVINPEAIIKFISVFKYQLKKSLTGKVNKDTYIQVLGKTDTSFREKVLGKEVDYGLGRTDDGILLMSFDNVPDGLVGVIMNELGIKGIFSKKINKSLFHLNDGNIYKHSMNNGHRHNIASVVTNEELDDLKEQVTTMINVDYGIDAPRRCG